MKAPRPTPGLLSSPQQCRFRKRLLTWYYLYRRDLPWRVSRDPYRVWLSEIMLQQTRVAAVIAHYREFLRRFSTVKKLAAAREASVLAAWSGLGYYRRARMMHAAAKLIVHEHGGTLPATAQELLMLPGIGRYTAAAIASIAFNEPVAVVDGNVERVLQRVSGKQLAKEMLWSMADEFMDKSHPGDFNQAMMELGATVCTPRMPTCLTCPVIELCATRGELMATSKPVLQKKREIHYVLDSRKDAVFLVQRPGDASLMPGMWELPEFAVDGLEQLVPLPRFGSHRLDKGKGRHPKTGPTPSFTLRHSITITDYTVHVWRAVAASCVVGKWTPIERLKLVALTGLARKILRAADII